MNPWVCFFLSIVFLCLLGAALYERRKERIAREVRQQEPDEHQQGGIG